MKGLERERVLICSVSVLIFVLFCFVQREGFQSCRREEEGSWNPPLVTDDVIITPIYPLFFIFFGFFFRFYGLV